VSNVDDLFAPEPLPGGPPAPPPVDRLRRVRVILGVALPLNLVGVFCLTGVPGAILTLVGWQLADEEVARAEAGVVSKEQLPRARRARDFAFGQLVFVLLSLTAQVALFTFGVYDALLEAVVALFGGVFGGL